MKLREAIQEHMVSHLLQLSRDELQISNLPEILLVDEPFLEGGDKKSFGEFDGKTIRVVTKNRHPMDVMRTLAHELTHWKQNLAGEEMDGSDGSETENEANSMAGIIMRKFGEKYPNYFIESLP